MRDFKEWFDETGYNYYDEICEYLENCPTAIDLGDDMGIFDIDEFAFIKCEEIYEDMIGDYNDMAYEEYRDRLMEMED